MPEEQPRRTAKSGRERNRAYEEAQRSRGFIPVKTWVPAADKARLLSLAAACRGEGEGDPSVGAILRQVVEEKRSQLTPRAIDQIERLAVAIEAAPASLYARLDLKIALIEDMIRAETDRSNSSKIAKDILL